MFFCVLCVFIQTAFTERLWDTWANRDVIFKGSIERDFMAEREAEKALVAEIQENLWESMSEKLGSMLLTGKGAEARRSTTD